MEVLQNIWAQHQNLIVLGAVIGFIFPLASGLTSLALEAMGFKTALAKEVDALTDRVDYLEQDIDRVLKVKEITEQGDAVVILPSKID